MTLFWIIAAILVVVALAWLLIPMWRAKDKAPEHPDRRQMNIEVYRSQLKELERDLDNGVIDPEQFEQAKADLERGMAEDVLLVDESDGGSRPGSQRTVLVVATAVVVLLVPLVSVGLYQELGGGLAAIDPQKAPPPVAAKEHEIDIEGMVAQLAERMKNNPDDIEGWYMLGRSYQFLKRYQDAKAAYDQVLRLGGESNPDFLATYADVLAMLNDRRIGEDAMRYIQKALALDPDHVKALWLAGTATYQQGDLEGTLRYWERLAKVLPPGSEDARVIVSNVNAIRAQLGKEPLPIQTAGAGEARVSGVVDIAPDLKDRVSPDDTVFIFAKAVNGPRMPLAIMRVKVRDLPMHFTLDDSQAMSPVANLSAFPEVVVGARVSKTGNAMPSSGDLEGLSGKVNVADAGEVRIVIDRIIP